MLDMMMYVIKATDLPSIDKSVRYTEIVRGSAAHNLDENWFPI